VPDKGYELVSPVQRGDQVLHWSTRGAVSAMVGRSEMEVANLWRYAAPGQPDPTDEEVLAERTGALVSEVPGSQQNPTGRPEQLWN